MYTNIEIIQLARKYFDNVIFDPFKNHIIAYEKDLYYESSIWGAVFFESFVYFLANGRDINTTKKSANLNSVIEELRKQNNMEFFIEDGFLKYFDSIRSTRNSLVHDTQITKKKEIIKTDADNIYRKIIEILHWYFYNYLKQVEDHKTLIPIFVSTINPHTPEQVFLQVYLFDTMFKNGLNPIRVEFNDFDKKDPMSKVIKTINNCKATIVLGLERSHAYFLKSREGSKNAKEENHVIYTSGWLHIEAGMALALKQNVYVLSEKNIVSDGIFDRDWNSCNVIEIDSLDNYENKIDDFISHVVDDLNKK